MSDPQETEHLLDVIETLEDENAALKKRVAELEKLCEPVNPEAGFSEE